MPPSEPVVNDIQTQPPPTTQAVLQSMVHSKLVRRIAFGVIFVIILITALLIYIRESNKNKHITTYENPSTPYMKPTSVPQGPNSAGLQVNQQWVNCSDVRDVIDENNTLYVGCLGGVLIYDKTTNKITDQISMTQGLVSNIVTSLQKSQDTLYIGTQNGVSIYNLTTHKIKNLTIKDGLINGQNIYLALDGNDMWIGTFKGLSRYNTQTGVIKNFTSELVDNSTIYSVLKVFPTDKAIYVIILANNGSAGGVARYDKKTSEWTRYGPADFATPTAQLSRIDLNDITSVKDNVFITGMNGLMWKADDMLGQHWEQLNTVQTQLKKDPHLGNSLLFGLSDKVAIINDSIVYALSGQDNFITQTYPASPTSQNTLQYMTYNSLLHFKEKLFFHSTTGSSWLTWFNPDNGESGTYSLKERPTSFSTIAFVVNDIPYVCADGGVWRRNTISNVLEPFGSVSCGQHDYDTTSLYPIIGTSNIFSFTQSCGMACSQPEMRLVHFTDGSQTSLPLPLSLTQALQEQAGSYIPLTLESYDVKASLIRFVYVKQDAVHSITYNTTTQQWSAITNYQPPVMIDAMNSFCNKSYTFDTVMNAFSTSDCTLPLSLNGVTYTLLEATAQPQQYISSKIQATTSDKKSSLITIPLTPAPVMETVPSQPLNSPVRAMTITTGRIFVSSPVGIGIYDLTTKNWQTVGISDGLAAESVTSFAIGSHAVYATTDGGGFSIIPLQ